MVRGPTLRKPDGYYTTKEVSQQIGRSVATVIAWRRKNIFVPQTYMRVGELDVWLYSEQDIAELKKIVANMKIGRPPHDKKV